ISRTLSFKSKSCDLQYLDTFDYKFRDIKTKWSTYMSSLSGMLNQYKGRLLDKSQVEGDVIGFNQMDIKDVSSVITDSNLNAFNQDETITRGRTLDHSQIGGDLMGWNNLAIEIKNS